MSERKISHALRTSVWNTYIGNKFKAPCWCCSKVEITPFDFECGHVEAFSKGGRTDEGNLRPICSKCNKSMQDRNMIEFMVSNGFIMDLPTHQFNIKIPFCINNQNITDMIEKMSHVSIAMDSPVLLRDQVVPRIHKTIGLISELQYQNKCELAVMFDMFYLYLSERAPPHYCTLFYMIISKSS